MRVNCCELPFIHVGTIFVVFQFVSVSIVLEEMKATLAEKRCSHF